MQNATYSPAWWLPGPHAQSIWGRFFRSTSPLATRMERWTTPDDDFIDLLQLDAPPGRPHLLVLHGLEGTPRSHYVRGLFSQAHRRGWAATLLVFRGCGAELNHARRFYHSGETTDVAFVVDRLLAEHPSAPLVLTGVSLGGNVLLKYLGECGASLNRRIRSAAAVSVPFDLRRSSRHIDRGFARVYQRHFLVSLRRKALQKLERYPDLVPRQALARSRTMYEFDDRVTAPIHGFSSAEDYYERSSAIRWIERIAVRTLLLSAVDDPFLPAGVLEDVRAIANRNPHLQLEFPLHGGHVGFVAGANPLQPFYYGDWRVAEFLGQALGD